MDTSALRKLTTACLAALALSACGGDDDNDPAPAPLAATTTWTAAPPSSPASWGAFPGAPIFHTGKKPEPKAGYSEASIWPAA